MKILIVDDEHLVLSSLRRILRRRGYREVETCEAGDKALTLIRENDYDIVLLDLLMPELHGLQLLELTKPFRPATEFIILTAVDEVATAVKAVRLGAYDYLVKPVDNERLFLAMERAFEHKGLLAGLAGASSGRTAPAAGAAFGEIITRDRRMLELLSYAHVMARSGIPILISGESGTGKELLARGIHRAGPKPEGPFLAVNMASVPESMFESQFFGYQRGAFTGAERLYRGYFEQADGGTLFLDEIGELPVHLQPKLLRVLEERTVQRLGDTDTLEVDIRLISATNQDLDKACQEGRFRLDLLFRVKPVHIHVPPLRERDQDIEVLAEHFREQAGRRHRKPVNGFTPEAMEILNRMQFPGNVRELAQLVEHAVIVADGPLIAPHHLGAEATPRSPFARVLCTLKDNNETHVAFVMSQTGGNRQKTAEILGITVRQLQRKLAEMRDKPHWQGIWPDI